MPVDGVIHTGDLLNDGDRSDYSGDSLIIAEELLSNLRLPIFLINGNHDDAGDLSRLPYIMLPQRFDAERWPLAGVHRVGDVMLIALDARGDAAIDPAGLLPEAQLAALQKELSLCQQQSRRALIFLHYPPLALDCLWLDRSMLLSNGEKLHKLLAKYHNQVSAVLFGHIHQSLQQWVDGVLYCAAGSTAFAFKNWPQQAEPGIETGDSDEAGHVIHFNYLSLTGDQIIIRQKQIQQ